MHGPGHYSEVFKVLREYTKKCSRHYTYKYKQARSRGNKSGKTFKFENNAEEVNIMKSHDEPTPKHNEGKVRIKKSVRAVSGKLAKIQVK